MTQEPFRIQPDLQAYIDPLSEEELRMLEESILAEGVRDPLVVWKEENVLVDGHHRKSICDKHGISYSVVYRSFESKEQAKAWMDLNQLGRRNLSRDHRNELIRRLAANGVRQKEIAEKVGLSKPRVSEIINQKSSETEHLPSEIIRLNLNQTSTLAELARLQAEIDSLLTTKKENQTTVEYLRRKLAEKPQEIEVTKEVTKEVEVVKEVLPMETQERLKLLEAKEREATEKLREKERIERELAQTKQKLEEIQALADSADKLRRKKDRLESEIIDLQAKKAESAAEATLEKLVEMIEAASSIKTVVRSAVQEEGRPIPARQLERIITDLGILMGTALEALEIAKEAKARAIKKGGDLVVLPQAK
nr:ParB N-terminal domain-containing protein [uncultured Dethiosulfovibrio sp.]